jgi:hypothetical protein
VSRATSEIQVDAELDEPAWANAAVFELPWEWSPGENEPAPVETTCRVTYDAEALYIGCHARDPNPGEIRAHLADRDTPFGDDHISVLLDTFDDQRRAFQFRVNPHGVQFDALTSSMREDFSWDAIWESDGRITGDGYVVEMAIPFESLRFPEADSTQTWGVIFGRSWPRSVRHRIRSIRTDYQSSCLLCQAEPLTGFRGVEPGTQIELNPTVTTVRTDRRGSLTAPSLEQGPVDVEPGLTASWGISTDMSVAATVNPDFSQVEADVAQLRTNRRFALFFPEKRPFFSQGSQYFQDISNLIYTRSVVSPVAGAKFTGQQGPHSLGVFVARDEAPSLIIPGSQSSAQAALGRDVTAAAARYQMDVGRSSSVGGLATLREGAGYHNRVVEADATLRVGESTQLVGLLAHSSTAYPDALAESFEQPAGTFTGEGAGAVLLHQTRDWQFQTQAFQLDPTLRADVGFMPRVGYRQANVRAGRTLWGRDAEWFSRFDLVGTFLYQEATDGEVLQRSAGLDLGYEGPLQSEVTLELDWQDQAFAGRLFSLAQQELSVEMEPSSNFTLEADVTRGTDVDFANRRTADLFRAGPTVEWRAGERLNLRAQHDLERLSKDGEEIFTANLSQLRLVYHLGRKAFLRADLQYRHVERNPGMYDAPVDRVSEQLFSKLLFSYELNPRTVLYAGYTGNRAAFEGREGPDANPRSVDLTQTDRTFFLKVGYAWRP